MFKMDPYRNIFLLVACCLSTVNFVAPTAGPVFINPNVAEIPSSQPAATTQQNYVTQTVYGFLDFTTTIGNTVMVFSPQSATISDPVKEAVSNSVVETRPDEINKELIQPSKTQISEKQSIPLPSPPSPPSPPPLPPQSSVVQVFSDTVPFPINNVEIKPSSLLSSQVNIVQLTPQLGAVDGILSSKVDVVNVAPSTSTSSKLESSQNVITKVEIISGLPEASSQPSSILSSKVEIVTSSKHEAIVNSIVEVVKSDGEAAVIIGNNIGEPEYDFLSRQPSEVVEQTYKVINLKPSSKFHLKPRPSTVEATKNKPSTKRVDSLHPTGLVTKLGGTVVKDGITTVHETSVIGTYISGKYAQVLQSTSHIHNNHQKNKINPSSTLRILKTAAPAHGKGGVKHHHHHLEPTPAGSVNDETVVVAAAAVSGGSGDANLPHIKSTRKATGPGSSGSSFKLKYKNRQKEVDTEGNNNETDSHHKKTSRQRSQNSRNSKHNNSSQRPKKLGRSNRKTTTTTTTESVRSDEAAAAALSSSSSSSTTTTNTNSYNSGKRYQSRRNKQQRNISNNNNQDNIVGAGSNVNNNGIGFSRRGYKPKVQTSTVEQISATTSLYKFKLNRSPGRWQYKTTPKPRITIRKQNDEVTNDNETTGTTPSGTPDVPPQLNDVVTPQARSDDGDGLEGSESIASIIDDESSTENKLDTPFPLETLKVEISTPPDFKDIYYEIATIKSPYTFQLGNVKNTRYITVTSTFEKSLMSTSESTLSPTASEPLTENILATSSNYAKDNNFLDSSVATLPPIYLASDMETPPLETLTETFSTTQTMLKTHILPFVRNGNETSTSTLVQTYLVTRLVSALKTLPPMEAYHFIPSKTLNEFNSHLDEAGSELHLELEFGDENEQDEENTPKRASFPSDLDLSNIGSDFDISDVDKTKMSEGHLRLKKAQQQQQQQQQYQATPKPTEPMLNSDQLQQLALLRFLNPGAAAAAAAVQGQIITSSKPILKLETVYESHIIPITNGPNTILSTISKIIGTVTKTDYEFITSTITPTLPIPPVPIAPVNPLFPPAPFAVTSSPVIQSTFVTQTDSKILKLTFGAKTAYTTIFSTKVVPSLVTSYMTASIPVQPTAAYPGFFPAPYPGYPFVG